MSQTSKFDSDVVRKLAQILNETNLTEIEYEGSDCKIRVARQLPDHSFQMHAPPAFFGAPQGPHSVAAAESSPVAMPQIQDPSKHPGALKAPMVGLAYMAVAPGNPPFVTLGDVVTKGQTLMIIEAMKVMNQIKAPKDGMVKQILCHDGDPVEYDQVLFVIE